MKRILFLTGTRADFGKLKTLIEKVDLCSELEAYIFITGMHMLSKYGMTANEVIKCNYKNNYKYINQNANDTMDSVLAKTIMGLTDYVKEIKPDMIVVHGDRVEALAGAIVGSLNNILVSHIEGGEVSGTVDEIIRHSVSKMAHLHFVSNDKAKSRLLQLGEIDESIYVIGSPDLDVMVSKNLPDLDKAKERYDIQFREYAIAMYHPVTTEISELKFHIREFVDSLLESDMPYIVIYPNNDSGTEIILDEYERLKKSEKVKLFPSIRFEYFLTLLKGASFIIGNSSAGVREAPFYGIPTINVGSRQHGRATAESICSLPENRETLLKAIGKFNGKKFLEHKEFGDGGSADKFYCYIQSERVWGTKRQKTFVDFESSCTHCKS